MLHLSPPPKRYPGSGSHLYPTVIKGGRFSLGLIQRFFVGGREGLDLVSELILDPELVLDLGLSEGGIRAHP